MALNDPIVYWLIQKPVLEKLNNIFYNIDDFYWSTPEFHKI